MTSNDDKNKRIRKHGTLGQSDEKGDIRLITRVQYDGKHGNESEKNRDHTRKDNFITLKKKTVGEVFRLERKT